MKHGLSAVWNENGEKEREVYYKDDKPWFATSWKPDGSKCPITNLKDGKGVEVRYHSNGQKDYEANYRDGKNHGVWTAWHENGVKSYEINFKDGMKHGLNKTWNEVGQVERHVRYEKNKLVEMISIP